MSNLSYCRFRNTLIDLEDCQGFLWDNLEDLSEEEARARKQLIKVCQEIAEDTEKEEGEINETLSN